MTNSSACNSEDEHGNFDDYSEVAVTLFIFASCMVGAISRSLLKKLPIPYTVFLMVVGLIFGALSSRFPSIQPYTAMARAHPHIIIFVFLPVLVFESAFDMEAHTFFRSFAQILLLSVPGLALASLMTAVFAMSSYDYNWGWPEAMMYGSILSATDPVAVVALLKDVGASKHLSMLIEGESLLNDGAAIVLFDIFEKITERNYIALALVDKATLMNVTLPNSTLNSLSASDTAAQVGWSCLYALGGPLYGLVLGKIATFWLSKIFNDAITEITITLSVTYVVFYTGESFARVSGVLAVVVLGVVMSADKTSISPEVEAFLHRFWQMLAYLANTLIFILVGVLIMEQGLAAISANDAFYVVLLYCALIVIRAIVIGLFSPILAHMGYGMTWRTGVVLCWGGLRGAVSLALALLVARNQHIPRDSIGNKVLLHTAGIVLLSLLINATTTKWLLRILGMSDISVPKRMAMANAVRTLRKTKDRTLSMLKTDRFLADSDYDFVDQHTPIMDPYKTNDDEADLANLTYLKRVSVCPDCDQGVPNEPSVKELEEMGEEARHRLLKAQRTSYWKQFEQGMLSREAVRKLVEMSEEATDTTNGYMDVEEMKKSWQVRGIFAYLRGRLEKWIKGSSYSQIPPPEKECLMGPYFAANSLGFEIFIYIVIFTNLIPIAIELTVDEQSDMAAETRSEYMFWLRIVNYVYFGIYWIEAFLKTLGLRKYYFLSHWNQFDLVILLASTIDIILDQVIDPTQMSTLHLNAGQIARVAKVAKIFRLLRISRALRLTKAVIPPIIRFLNNRINKRLSFGYDVGMGFVMAEEEVRKLLEQMIDDKKIANKIKNIIEKGRLEVVKELGLLQRDMPGIAVSVKTRHAIRVVLNNLRDTISDLRGDGLLDDMESAKLENMVEVMMKRQQSAPSYIAPPGPERIMRNIPWIAGDDHLLGFVKQKAKLTSFDYGDKIMKRGEAGKGLFIIVSGLVRVEAVIGHADVEDEKFVDYLTTGSIIGEMSLITQKPRTADVTCETAVQSYFLSKDHMNLAMQAFQGEPSLEYRLWRVCAIRLAAAVLMKQVNYHGLTQDKIKLLLEISYLPYIQGKKTFEITATMKDVVLIQGYAHNAYTMEMFVGPCYVSNTTDKLIFVAKEPGLRNVILVVPRDENANIPEAPKASMTALSILPNSSSLCLLHASRHRLELTDRISAHHISKRGSVGRLIAKASSNLLAHHQLPSVEETDKPQESDFAKRFPKLHLLLKHNERSEGFLPPLAPVPTVGTGPRLIQITPPNKSQDGDESNEKDE